MSTGDANIGLKTTGSLDKQCSRSGVQSQAIFNNQSHLLHIGRNRRRRRWWGYGSICARTLTQTLDLAGQRPFRLCRHAIKRRTQTGLE
jgi:hypothetical protein